MKTSVYKLAMVVLAASFSGGALPAETAEDAALEALMTKGWPSGKISPTVPEFTGGKIINSGGDAQTYYIKVRETNEAALEGYLALLKKAGWVVSDDHRFPSATKELVKLDFNWEGTTGLQITVRQSEEGRWPTADLPPEIVAPPHARFGGRVEVVTNEEDRMWYFTFTCLGLQEAEAREWLRGLLKQGWEGDENQLTRKFTWKGKKMSASLEVYETNSDSTSFTYNFGVDD